jgi:putative peptidoglycan lipid II flippase
MGPLAHTGLALATAIANAANLAGLLWLLRRRLGGLGGRALAASTARVAAASALMAAAVAAVAYLADWGPAGGWAWRYARPLAGVAAGAASYLAAARLLGMAELGELWRALRRRA